MSRFNVGDRVRYVGKTNFATGGNNNRDLKGVFGTITNISPWSSWESTETSFILNMEWDNGSFWNVLEDQVMLDTTVSPHWKIIKRINEIDNRRKTLGYTW
jgi:hypothetical protein